MNKYVDDQIQAVLPCSVLDCPALSTHRLALGGRYFAGRDLALLFDYSPRLARINRIALFIVRIGAIFVVRVGLEGESEAHCWEQQKGRRARPWTI